MIIQKPLPEGFTSRGATQADVEIATRLMNDYSQHYLETIEATSDAIYNEWISPGFDPSTDIRLVFSPSGEAVGYTEAWDTANPPVHPWVWWCIHPQFLGQGISSHLLSWAEARVRQAIDRCPPGTRVAYRAGVDTRIQPAKMAMQKHGMNYIRSNYRMGIEMQAPPPQPVWPEDIHLKVFDLARDDLAEVYQADTDAFRDHFGFVESPFEEALERFKYFMTGEDAYQPGLWYLAMANSAPDGSEQIAGICLNRKHSWENPQVGWVSTLGVLRPWRRRGIGLALLLQSFGEFYRRGFRQVELGVDAESLTGALDLYEKAGMHVRRQFDLYEKELRPGDEISVQSLQEDA
jgi:mycothiol synthase